MQIRRTPAVSLRASSWVLAAVIGMVFGTVSGMANAFVYPGQVIVSQAFAGIWLWILIPAVLAHAGRTVRESWLLPMACIVPAVIVYYVWELVRDLRIPGIISVDVPGTIVFTALYIAAGAGLSLVLALTVRAGRSASRFAGLAHLVVPVLLVLFSWSDMTWQLDPNFAGYDARRIVVGAVFGYAGALAGCILFCFAVARIFAPPAALRTAPAARTPSA